MGLGCYRRLYFNRTNIETTNKQKQLASYWHSGQETKILPSSTQSSGQSHSYSAHVAGHTDMRIVVP